ncbi:MAG: hypothetical protein HKN36_11870 [Hellea sp.]|nr:hypothetical protein [Hellea sp.]
MGACAKNDRHLVPQDLGSGPSIQVYASITPDNDGLWSVDITTSELVHGLIFDRNTGDHRQKSWALDDSAFILERIDQKDIVKRQDGAVFNNLSAKITPYRDPIIKEYTLFGAFTNGADRVYAGQFRLSAVDADFFIMPTAQNLIFNPGNFDSFFGDNERRNGPYSLTSKSHQSDGYVIYGDVPVTELAGAKFMIDPGAPEWIATGVQNFMKSGSDYFEQMLGPATGPDILTLISFDPDETSSGVSIEGGVLADQVHFHISGSGLANPDPDVVNHFGWVAIHEAAHTWNAFGAYSPEYFFIDPNEPENVIADAQWLHEGGAEYLTYKAVIRRSLTSAEYADSRLTEFYDECVSALKRGPLNLAANENRFEDYYSCGMIIGLMTDAACRYSEIEYEDIWLRMLAKTGEDNRYGQELYFDALDECAMGADANRAIRQMATGSIEDPRIFLENAFDQLHVTIRTDRDYISFDPDFIRK